MPICSREVPALTEHAGRDAACHALDQAVAAVAR
jgi:hypothetical protein